MRTARALAAAGLAGLGLTLPASGQETVSPASVVIQGDRIEHPLTTPPGDPSRGRAIVVDRQKGLCLLCHTGPFPEQRFQGTLAPDLAGAGSRLSPAELRLRLVDSRAVNPATIMPSYYKVDGLERVARTFAGKPILDAQQIEDVVAFLATLVDGTAGKDKP